MFDIIKSVVIFTRNIKGLFCFSSAPFSSTIVSVQPYAKAAEEEEWRGQRNGKIAAPFSTLKNHLPLTYIWGFKAFGG